LPPRSLRRTRNSRPAAAPRILVGHVTPTLEFPEHGQSAISRLRNVGAKF
jgi:hypothetical protein